MMRKIVPLCLLLRAASPAAACVSLLTGLLCFGFSEFQWTALSAVFISALVLSYYPSTYESTGLSAAFVAGSATLLPLLPIVFGSARMSYRCLLPVAGALVLVYSLLRLIDRFSCLKILFRNENVWYSVEDNYRMLGRLSLPVVGVFPVLSEVLFTVVAAAAVCLTLAVMMMYTCRTGRILLMSRKAENTIRGVMRLCPTASAEGGNMDDARMCALYARVTAYMDSRKPFLSEDFTLGGLAMAMCSNRVYLSRIINYYSGRNFKQFVNYYRVMYAVELIKRDPRLSLMELATMSGFHSLVTFHMAFKLNMEVTPGAYARDEAAKRL